MDAQWCGGIVAYIHIRDAIMHHGVRGVVNFKLQQKKKRGKKLDMNVKIGSNWKDIHNKRVMVWNYLHGEGWLVYIKKGWKEYKWSEVKEHSMWRKENKWGRGYQRKWVWTKKVERSIATSRWLGVKWEVCASITEERAFLNKQGEIVTPQIK